LGVLGKMNPLGVFESTGTPKRHFLARYRVVKIGRAVIAGRGDKKPTKKLTQSLYVDRLWAGPL
jgi:hypothetical protein